MRDFSKTWGCLIMAGVAAATPETMPALAQQASFAGKTITMTIGYPPGGGFDATARLLMRHMPRYLPGTPSMIPKNMPGAGSVIAANYLYNVAPKDGTEIGIIGNSVPISPLWNRDGIQFEATKFNWLGSLDRWTGIVAVWHTAPATTYEQVLKTEIIVGATGSGDVTAMYPRVLNALLGTKFKIVPGYKGSPDLNLAIEQGEVHGRLGWCWDCMKADKPDWIAENKIKVMIQLAFQKHPELPDVPLVIDLAKTEEDRQIMRLVFASQDMARPFLAPPGVPADRVKILRTAFDATAKDKEFLAEADKLKLPIAVLGWQEMEKLIADVYATPPSVIARAIPLINGK